MDTFRVLQTILYKLYSVPTAAGASPSREDVGEEHCLCWLTLSLGRRYLPSSTLEIHLWELPHIGFLLTLDTDFTPKHSSILTVISFFSESLLCCLTPLESK